MFFLCIVEHANYMEGVYGGVLLEATGHAVLFLGSRLSGGAVALRVAASRPTACFRPPMLL